MDNNELQHWGIKGMQWGRRRYQNADGSLTDAGKKRYDRDQRENKNKKKGNRVGEADPDRWVKEDTERTKRLTDEVSGLTNKAKNAVDSSIRNNQKVKMDLSKMTDQQMRDEINRALLERQYNEMFAPKKSTKGREIVSGILGAAGTVLGLGSTALGIALSIKDLRG